MKNLLSVTRPSPQILGKTQTGIFPTSGSGQSLTSKNCHTSGTSNDIGIKRGPVTTTRDKRNTVTSKKLDDNVISAKSDALSFF